MGFESRRESEKKSEIVVKSELEEVSEKREGWRIGWKMIPTLSEYPSAKRLYTAAIGICIFTVFTVDLALLHEMSGIFAFRPFDVFSLIVTISFLLVSTIFLYPILASHYRLRILVEEEVKRLNMKYHEGLQEFQHLREVYEHREKIRETAWQKIIEVMSKDPRGFQDFAYLHNSLLEHLWQEKDEIDRKRKKGMQTFEQIKKEYIRKLINATAEETLEDTTYNFSSYEMPVSFCMLTVAFGFVVSSLIPFFGTGKIQFGNASINLIWAAGGFIGAYLYSLHPFFQRYTRRDLPPRAFLHYAIKVFLGTIAVTVFGNLFLGDFAEAYHFSFAAVLGSVPFLLMNQARKRVFSELGWGLFSNLRWGTSKVGVGSQDVFKITGITYEYAERLHEEGIMNIQNLAFIDAEILSKRTMFNKDTLFDWKDEAILRLLTQSVSVVRFLGEKDEVIAANLYEALVDVGINNVTILATRLECVRGTEEELEKTGEEYTCPNTESVINLIKLLGWKDEREEYRYFLIKTCIQGMKMLGEISEPSITAFAY